MIPQVGSPTNQSGFFYLEAQAVADSFGIEVMPVADIVHGTVWDAQKGGDGEISLSY